MLPKPQLLLDLACGTGILCQILHSRGIRTRGMDLSSGMIEIARSGGQGIAYDVADMVTYRPEETFHLVTCTGDAFNHIPSLEDLQTIFQNIHGYLAQDGWLVFDILNEHEVSTSEPFEMDFDEHTRVWFQMTRPTEAKVNLKIRVFEDGRQQFEENIRETVHDPASVCALLQRAGFEVLNVYEYLTLDHPTETSEKLMFVARKL